MVKELHKSLSKISFIIIDQETAEVNFLSKSFRKYAAEKLQFLRKDIIELMIDDLLADHQDQKKLSSTPGYFEQVGRYDDLLNYLSPENFMQIIECSKSLSPLRQQATLGVDISKKLARDGELIEFSTQKSIILGTDKAKAWTSELEALMYLDDYKSALSLAQSTILKEDLFQALAVIATKKLDKEHVIDQELLDQIRNLYNQIDPKSLGDRTLDIASTLIYIAPDLAIELVEKSTNSNASTDNSALDWAFAKLSLDALNQKSKSDLYERIQQKIQDPRAKNVTSAVSLLLGEHDAKQVIAEAEKFENPIDGLFFLRLWSTEKREREDAYLVVNYAINLAIRTTAYTPNARDFRQLANPLPYISDSRKLKILYRSLTELKAH